MPLSGASPHAAVAVDSQITGDDLRRRLVAAGFTDAEVDDVEPTIEDVFVNLVSQNR